MIIDATGMFIIAYHISSRAHLLTHCGLVTPYGDIDLDQHYLR